MPKASREGDAGNGSPRPTHTPSEAGPLPFSLHQVGGDRGPLSRGQGDVAVAEPRPDRIHGRGGIVERAEMILQRDQPLHQQLVAWPEDGGKELNGIPEALRIDAQRVQGR